MINNASLNSWIEAMRLLTKPDRMVLIDGSGVQLEALRAEAVASGELIRLN